MDRDTMVRVRVARHLRKGLRVRVRVQERVKFG